MKHLWSILCNRAVVDKNTNSLSIFDIVDEIFIPVVNKSKSNKVTIPANLTMVSIIVDYDNSKERKGVIEVEIKNSKNKIINKNIREFTMKKGVKRMRVITVYPPLAIDKDSDIKFVIKLKKENDNAFSKVAEFPISLNYILVSSNNEQKIK